MFLNRNMSARLVQGNQTTISEQQVIPWRLTDVPKYMALALGANRAAPTGKVYAESGLLASAASPYTLTLPNAYASGVALASGGLRLRCCIRTNQSLKLTKVSPDTGTSVFLIKATNGATLGAHDGYCIFTDTVTSLTLSQLSSGAADAQFETMLYELPDITQQTAFRAQDIALGVVTTFGDGS